MPMITNISFAMPLVIESDSDSISPSKKMKSQTNLMEEGIIEHKDEGHESDSLSEDSVSDDENIIDVSQKKD